ncbi:MAG TPA: LAGLIDADG family homing endonuclease, partial [Thermoplasmata archaeon]|nr:LAGLIDADG family homing endonuclease [Thermoplasmata archaeon]
MAAVKRTLPAPPELQSRWAAVLEEAGRRIDILALSDRLPEERSLTLSFSELDRADTALADLLIERPEEVLHAGQRAMRELLPTVDPATEALRLRVVGLPATAHRLIREIRESDLNRLIALDGIVRRVTEVRPQIRDAVFQCVSCRTEFHEPQDEASMVFREPLECPESQGGCGKPQGRTRFRLLPEKSTYVDSQRIEVQENPETLKHGAHPQGLAVMLTEDLAGQVLPGNRVVLNGVLKSFQRASASRGGVIRNTTFDLLVLGNSVEWKQQEYDEIEITPEEEQLFLGFRGDPTVVDKIVMSLAPSIKGMEEEKEAIALQLFGGVEKRHPDGVRVRGDVHCLLVGDPGTAKSQLLRYIADVAPRGVYTSGKGATAAGLTAAAVKDDFAGGRWVLEAGMLVLADGGMAVIDELDKMTPEDRSAMHEALEQQSYHPDFEIMLANGERRPIGAFVDGWFATHPERTIPGRDCEILPLRPGELSVLSSDFQRLFPVPVDRVSRHRAPSEFVRVRYASGRSIVVTPEHPLFVWRGGRWTTTPAESVEAGNFAPGVSAYPRSLNEAVLRPPEVRTGPADGVFPDEITPELGRLLGYLVGEGHGWEPGRTRGSELRVGPSDCRVMEDARSLVRALFRAEPADPLPAPRAGRRSSVYALCGRSRDVLPYLRENFPEAIRDAPDKRVPGPVLHATLASRIEFLRGAYRAGGFDGPRGLGLRTSSEGLARDYSDLLLSVGVYSILASPEGRPDASGRASPYRVIITGGESRRRFRE